MRNKKNLNLMTQHSAKGFYKIDKIHLLVNKILPLLTYIIYLHISILEYKGQLKQEFGHL